MSKLYFEEDSEYCHTIEGHKLRMAEDGIEEIKVYEAKMMVGEPFFWCRFFGGAGEVGENCGKECSEYKPRNGKNGRCVHSRNCYEPTDKFRILKIKIID